MFDYPLKKYSAEAIQDAIAKALSDLCGTTMEVEIHAIDYNKGSEWSESAGITLTARKKRDTKDLPF